MSHNDDNSGNEQFWKALRRTISRVIDVFEQAAADEQFRDDIKTLVCAAVHRDSTEPPTNASPPASSPELQVSPKSISTPVATSAASVVPLPPLILGPRVVEAPISYPRQWTAEGFDPSRVSARCRIKAQATRWQTERRRQIDAGHDVLDQDHALVDRARDQNVYLWMVSPSKWRERTDAAFSVVGGCYDALAEASELMALADQLGRSQVEALKLLAEAQSALRAAVEDYGSTHLDEDQNTTFVWLRDETYKRRVFVEYMQRDHPADPQNFAELRRRIQDVRTGLNEVVNRDHQVEKLISKIAFHARKLQQAPPDMAIAADDHNIQSISTAVASLLHNGTPASDIRIRDALLPVMRRIPGDVSQPLLRILEGIDEALEQSVDDDSDADTGEDGADSLVVEAGRLVEGRHAVMVGGVPKESSRQKLQQALGLASLNWVHMQHHESFDATERAIRRDGVGLVIIMTRWRAHRDGPAARALCRQLGIPLVELPGGYNLRQVAHQLVSQLHRAPIETR